ncbi:hypothetical protein EYD10_06433 [Varanus komodoensis]|nr:hypothetical protein EYD10_06433 [Varanus komodoensis]
MALPEARACSRLLLQPRIILFGDSITEFSFQEKGWGTLLTHRLVRKCDVLNRGLSGYNSRWAKMVLPRLINKEYNSKNTVAVTIFFGANDAALKGVGAGDLYQQAQRMDRFVLGESKLKRLLPLIIRFAFPRFFDQIRERSDSELPPDLNPKQHVPLEEYADNLKSMIQYLKSVDIAEDKVILVTPSPLHEDTWEKECISKGEKLNRLNSITGEYAKACVQVARDCGTDVIDLWTLMQKNSQGFCCYLSDGLHLSEEGNNFLANQLWPLLEQRTSTLPVLLPYWRDVDHLHPEVSLLEQSS